MTPGKAAAYKAVQRALRTGQLVRPYVCQQCGQVESQLLERRAPRRYDVILPSAHHHHGYGGDHALDVIWLCHLCHNRAHGAQLAEARRQARDRKRPR